MKCLTPECQEEQIYSRQLCRRCYQRLFAKVRRGPTRWGDLIAQGLAGRAGRNGASSEKRRQAQPKGPGRKVTYGARATCKLTKLEYDYFLKQYQQGYRYELGDMSTEQLKQYEELLGLSGPDDPGLSNDV